MSLSFHWSDVMALILLAGVKQVIASGSVQGFCNDECSADEICCSDGFCCSSFETTSFAWMVMVVLLFTTVVVCLCLPRFSPWKSDSIHPVQYHFLTAKANDVPYTKQYELQPQTPLYYPLATESWPQQYHPYRCEQLVQQSLQERSYPEPSAPPEP